MLLFAVLVILSSTALNTINAQYNAAYSGATTVSSQSYSRSGAQSVGTYYFQAIEVRVSLTGTYTFQSSSSITDTIGYIYQGNLYTAYPQYNIVAQDDDGAGRQFKITATLRSDLVYYLIFTSYTAGQTGTFDISASGPGTIVLTPVVINT